MSAPTSGSSGSSSASPVPGYYPDPSIPNYIRYWNGSAWVPGTSRPAPVGAAAGGEGGGDGSEGRDSGPEQGRTPAADESGPVYLDEDPAAPRAHVPQQAAHHLPERRLPQWQAPQAPQPPEHPLPQQGGPHQLPPAAEDSGAARPASGEVPAWPRVPPPSTERPAISWGAEAQPQPAHPQPAQPQPPAQPEPQPLPTAQPSAAAAPQAPARTPARTPAQAPAQDPGQGWAAQVQGLAREGGGWHPPAADPFGLDRALDRPGGLLRRFAARVIDGVLAGAVTAAAAVPLGAAAYHHAKDKVDQAKQTGETVKVWLLDGTTGAELGAVVVVFLLAGVLLEVWPTARWGRTAGKRLVGLRVLDIEAQLPPAFGASLRRWLTRTVLNLLLVGVVGVAWCLFDRPWKQCWHDKAARTFVAAV
ncbi:RDD family protein [Streptomyces sp. V4-01]|uniref:RDD family protein n=1 Tax=Actinacidiphila polyblastidii TaxID=3110430 RepID=A0ABU7P8P8_9ACTN|nr:RDD family protein [Streptomyces sp. V4-01]